MKYSSTSHHHLIFKAMGLCLFAAYPATNGYAAPLNPRRIATGEGRVCHAMSLSPDCHTLAVSTGALDAPEDGPEGERQSEVELKDVDSTRVICKLAGHTGRLTQMLYSPDGKILAAVDYRDPQTRRVLFWRVGEGIAGKSREPETPPALHPYAETAASIEAALPPGRNVNLKLAGFSPDGSQVVGIETVFQQSARMMIWDTVSGKLRRAIDLPVKSSYEASFLGDAKELVVASSEFDAAEKAYVDANVQLIDAATGQRGAILVRAERNTRRLAFSRNGRLFATGSYGNDLSNGGITERSIQVWELPAGRLLHTLRLTMQPIRVLKFSDDGSRLFIGGFDGSVQAMDVTTGAVVRSLQGAHLGIAYMISAPADGRVIATMGEEQQDPLVWNTEAPLAPAAPAVRTVATMDQVAGMKFSADGSKLTCYGTLYRTTANGPQEFVISQWDLAKRKLSGSTLQLGEQVVITFLASAQLLVSRQATGSNYAPAQSQPMVSGGGMVVWDIESRKPVYTEDLSGATTGGMAATEDGSLLAVAIGRDGRSFVKIVDLKSGKFQEVTRIENTAARSLEFSTDGSHLAILGDGVVSIYSIARGALVRKMTLRNNYLVTAIALSSDGRHLSVASTQGGDLSTHSGHVTLWDCETGDMPWGIIQNKRVVRTIKFVPAQHALAVGVATESSRGNSGKLVLLDVETGLVSREYPDICAIRTMTFGANGSLMATADYGHVRLWDMKSLSANDTP